LPLLLLCQAWLLLPLLLLLCQAWLVLLLLLLLLLGCCQGSSKLREACAAPCSPWCHCRGWWLLHQLGIQHWQWCSQQRAHLGPLA
jgi:hypothetical protein